jgi:hypothetical protein
LMHPLGRVHQAADHLISRLSLFDILFGLHFAVAAD